MSVRKRKKKDKQRGMRTHGKGNTKNSRGAGSRGGRGRAGSHKHKYSKYYESFGGTKHMKPAKKKKSLNILELETAVKSLIAKKKAEERNGSIFIDGKKAGISKILGRGTPTKKLVLKNIKASSRATEKIVKAGGKVESTAVKNKEKQNITTREKENNENSIETSEKRKEAEV